MTVPDDFLSDHDQQEPVPSWEVKGNECKSCLLPIAPHGSHQGTRWALQEVTTVSLHKVEIFCERNKTDLASLVTAAWSIVLHQFSEMEILHFGLYGMDMAGALAGYVPGREQVLTMAMNLDSPIRELLRTNCRSINSLQSDAASRICFNTGIEFRINKLVKEPLQLEKEEPDKAHFVLDSERYDALIIVDSDGEKLRFTLKHNSAALPNQQAASIAGSIMQAIQCFWQDLNQKVRDVDLVDRRSRGYIAQWNNRAMAIDYHLSIAGSIDKISHLKPDAQAIASWDGELTYGQLENLSSRLALHLKGLGIGESVMVPLCFGKSSWAIVATLAVLKSGAAFVPLDASHPLTRLKEIITHVNAAFVLVSDQHAALFAGTADNVIVISESTVGHLQDVGILAHHAQPHHVAYVLFTSGSTGSPKGCVVEHRALAAVICHGEALGISTASRVLQFASYSFGVSLIEIFCTLTAGGVLCIPSDHERTNDPPGAIRRMKANWTLLTPSLVNCIDAECVPSLKTLVVAGEPLTKNVLEHWASKVRLISAYGLTEWAGICTVQTQILSIKNTHNIGSSPSANLWLVNPRNREVLAPIGAVAELLIEGPCLAQGYLGDTERTAAAFIENPSWLQPFTSNRTSRRLYRTGDLVRYSPDGTINYVGRKGLQAKIRGQRVELGEVEYHVCRHFLNTTKAIADVVVPAGEAQSPVLVAFILSRGHRSKEPERALAGPLSDSIFCEPDEAFRLNAATANFMIRDLLPDYMIPQAYVPLRYVPLTVTGKVSRLMLKDAVRAISYEALVSYTHIKQKVVSPVSNIEKILHRLVAHTLKLPPDAFGVNDSFFQLGGDSIKAMKLVTQGRAEGVFLTVQDIFLEKTVARISRCAEADDDRATLAQTDAEFRLSYIQQQMIHTEPKSSDGSTQKLCLRVKSSVDPSFLENAIYQVVRRHPMLRTRFSQNPNGEWTQAIEQEPRGTYNYKHRAASNETEALEIMATNQQILDIGNGPNFAALYINVAGGSQFLMLLAHELTVDQISWKIILADTETVLNGGTLTDQPPPKPFQEWCCSEQDKDLEHCVFAHNATLQDVSKQRLHSHAGDGLANSSHHVVRRFSVSPDATHSILSDAARVLRVEPIEIFQAAVLHSFTQTVESQDLPVMVIQEEGRELSHSGDFSNTIGPFVTLLPVEVVTSRQPDLLHILRQTKESYRQARKRRACPLAPRQGQLVEKSSLCVPRRQILLDFAMPSQQLGEWDSTLLQQTSFQARDYSNYIFAAHSGAWLGVSVSIINNCLEFSFRTLSDESLDVDLQHWSQECEQSIYNAVEILWQRNPIFTPSDFPLLDLKAAEIEHFLDARLSATGIDQADIEVAYPCSPIQQGMLLSQALQPQTYQMFFIWEVTNTGDRQRIDVDRLQSAWLQLTRYHSILRTIFVEGISQYPFIQVLLNPGAARTKVLRCANGDARATLLENKWSGQQGAPPLLPQFTVCETDSGRVLCALDISHLVTDATSMGILERDLALVYDALPISDGAQYGDYVKFLGSLPKDPALEYWRGYLAGCDPCFFPRLHEASAASSDPAELQSVQVPFKDTSQIYAFCHTTGLTASNILQVAWGLVLRAFTGQDTVCFGYLTSGRDAPIPGIENGVGPYINMLICRLDFNESAAAVTQLLRKAQTDFATALAHQHFSLSDLFHAMDLGGTTLFNTCMTFPPEDVYGEMDEKRSINMMEVENYMADEYAVIIDCRARGQSLKTEMRYWSPGLSETQAVRIAHCLGRAVDTIIQGGEGLHDVSLTSEIEWRLLRQWNGKVPARAERCVHALVEERCRVQPEAPAVCAWDGDFTYGELDALSSALAAHLAERGVGRNVFVPLCFEKSRWTTVAIVGVMKAGGAFVLLDPSHPRSRLEAICRTVTAPLVVSSAANRTLAGELAAVAVVVGDNEMAWREARGAWAGSPRVTPDDPLYAVFTSGSTGTSKGAVIEHASFCNTALAQLNAKRMTSNLRLFQFASYAFDTSICDNLTTLLAGGCICVPSESDRQDNMVASIRRFRCNWIDLTPSLARTLHPRDVPTVQTVVMGGEETRRGDLEVWSQCVDLVNAYGPAECSVSSVVRWEMDGDLNTNDIGYAVGCVCWVVDWADHERLLPLGAVGELLIEGPIVGRGYLNDPARTLAAFVEPPAWLRAFRATSPGNAGGDRLYKTGDLVKYAADGSLRFVGRKDTQVKLRGQRIELGEVEHHTRRSFPGARDVVAEVVTPAEAGRPPILVAFVLEDRKDDGGKDENKEVDNADDILAPPTDAFRAAISITEAALHHAVPAYMVPAVFLPLRAVPLSATGKTNRRLLREMGAALTTLELAALQASRGRRRAPVTEMERRLQGLWASTLGVDASSIGADDSFLRIGGDSIRAMRLVDEARKQGLSLTVRDVLSTPRLSTLAQVVRIAEGASGF